MNSLNQCFVVLSLLAAVSWELNCLPTGTRIEFTVTGSIQTTDIVANKSGKYSPSANPTTWEEATNECARKKLTLVELLSKAEADELKGSFQDEDFGTEFWIAGIFDGTSTCLNGNGYDKDCWYWKGNEQSIDRNQIGVDFDNQQDKPTHLSRVTYIPSGRSPALGIDNVTALKRFICQTR